MKIVTEEFEELFKDYPLYSQENESDPKVNSILVDSCCSMTQYLTEFDSEDILAYGCYFMVWPYIQIKIELVRRSCF
jgi:hypothetical protein